jgi:hypothetical protein
MIGENKRAWVMAEWLGGRAVVPSHFRGFIFKLNMNCFNLTLSNLI